MSDSPTVDMVGQYEADIAGSKAAEQRYIRELGLLEQRLLALHNRGICPLCFIMYGQKTLHDLPVCQLPIASDVVELHDQMV